MEKKETYEVGFEQAKKKCVMSVDKAHLAMILELSTPKEMFNALKKKYPATNAAHLRQILPDRPGEKEPCRRHVKMERRQRMK